jgi:replication-associated recombination protein RarA
VYLARAPKSNASYRALGAATADVREHGHLHPPALRSPLQRRGAPRARRRLRYPHDRPGHVSSRSSPRRRRRRTLLLARRRRGGAASVCRRSAGHAGGSLASPWRPAQPLQSRSARPPASG